MLPLATIEEIDRLLRDDQLSQRKIAKQLGVSRGTVAAVATGRRGMYGKEPEDETSRSLAPQSPPVRCPGCGFLIYMPCLVCSARTYRLQKKVQRMMLAVHQKSRNRRLAKRAAVAQCRALERARVA